MWEILKLLSVFLTQKGEKVMKIFQNMNKSLVHGAAAMLSAVLAVCSAPLSVSAVQERPPELPASELVSSDIPAAYQGDGDRLPTGEDFTWIYDVEDIFVVPDGAKTLKTTGEVSGSWKVFLIGQPTDKLCFYNFFNANIVDCGNNNVSLEAKWYKQTLVNRATGESTIMDNTFIKNEIYKGALTDESLYAEDPDNDIIDRYMFANGSFIKDFVFVNMYQKGYRQYALGVFSTDGGRPIGNAYMTREVTSYVGEKTTVNNTSGQKAVSIEIPDWSYFEGYWVYEYKDDATYQRDSIYVEPIGLDRAYVVIADESTGARMGSVVDIRHSAINNSLTLLNPDGTVFDVMNGTTFNGKDAVSVEGFGELMIRADKSEHAQEYWNYISDRFKQADVWYD